MVSMIERVAQAIYAKNAAAAAGRLPWAKAQDATKESVRDLARAAIGEMREPTEEMLDKMNDVCVDAGEVCINVCFADLKEIHAAAIDEALKEAA
ncbi:hypothetical protein J0664_06235 [Rhizobium leguminosarum]|uniref:hypothetical protein n=1 Tax=Rhizobium leguminosarum TaxID=384 RepID=UPI001A92A3BC|nr:hypothetical protein [Rhizobium leguminosarum]MBY5553691.1 hypothetical protein [Rhizobium leguminosarum]QSW24894.1 hypothetical protein J0664_06235 [Rhizobium leguminosarum]